MEEKIRKVFGTVLVVIYLVGMAYLGWDMKVNPGRYAPEYCFRSEWTGTVCSRNQSHIEEIAKAFPSGSHEIYNFEVIDYARP